MSNKQMCDNCKTDFPAERMLYCPSCGKKYCERCARRLSVCNCSGDLTYFD